MARLGHRRHLASEARRASLRPSRAPAARRRAWRCAQRPRAIELGLQQRELARRARRCWWPRRRRTARRRRGAPRSRRATPVVGRGDRRAARVELEPAAAGPRTRPADRSRRRARLAPRVRRGASAGSARRRPPSQSGQMTLTDASHESSPLVDAREDARVRPRVVEAAADGDLRPRAGRAPRSLRALGRVDAIVERAPLRALRTRLGEQRVGDRRRGDGRRSSGRRRLDRPAPSMPISRPRSASAIAALVARLDREHPLPRLLRLGRRARRSAGSALSRAGCAHRARARRCSSSDSRDDPLGFARGHQRPERARDLEAQVGAGRRQVLARRARARRGGALERVERGRRCRSATAGRAGRGSCRERPGR